MFFFFFCAFRPVGTIFTRKFSTKWVTSVILQSCTIPAQVCVQSGTHLSSQPCEANRLCFENERIWIADHFQTPTPRACSLLQVEEDNRCQGGIGQSLFTFFGRSCFLSHWASCALPPLCSIMSLIISSSLSFTRQIIQSDEGPGKRGCTISLPRWVFLRNISSILSHHSPPWTMIVTIK